ncbi:hypothetical protein G6F57_002471 [Rhizopus arrhizus]|uniref:Uncharacterized protein n=1 Tax=Rhizopus oryzae TaxID=64495 RepID=A0A9P6XK13_RHIOR|nr:hypothetical protein G6F24_004148 [Rhizopus arrhizus]KAG1427725.1 hypothetical protein G6F58_000894 [Rhizopus delemar]KAG0785883.1 hypothetical protein G6F22_007804 [Rhizopus arrhizus]KAG0795850.1 hypothetical protein G6F21_001777 [Rhizopus arrhizus]KAG0815706.1 hypothetical protein G6F20_003783 [Rhizopus arrhizus]
MGYRWNLSKCVILDNHPQVIEYAIYDQVLPQATTFTYLGIPFKSGGHIDPEKLVQSNIFKAMPTMNALSSIGIQGKKTKLLSSCRPTITLDPILRLPITHKERSRCIRWRLGWLPGGAPKLCPRHPNTNLSNMHHRLCMPETIADPISLLLNMLPTRTFVPSSIALS